MSLVRSAGVRAHDGDQAERLMRDHLSRLEGRVRRGEAQPQANFVTTTRAGQLLRVQMAPVLSVVSTQQKTVGGEGEAAEATTAAAQERTVTGFILMLENITRNFETESRRDQLLHNLTEGNRASLANVRAAADMLEFEDLTDDMRARFRKVVREQGAPGVYGSHDLAVVAQMAAGPSHGSITALQ